MTNISGTQERIISSRRLRFGAGASAAVVAVAGLASLVTAGGDSRSDAAIVASSHRNPGVSVTVDLDRPAVSATAVDAPVRVGDRRTPPTTSLPPEDGGTITTGIEVGDGIVGDVVVRPSGPRRPEPKPCKPRPRGHETGALAVDTGERGSERVGLLDPESNGFPPPLSFIDGREAVWSSDGTRLAYVKEGPEAPELWVAERFGGNPTRVIYGTSGISDPAWSPDGHTVAYVAGDPNDDSSIYTVNVDDPNAGSPALTFAPGFERGPAWSPDGSTIVYEGAGGLRVIAPDGSGDRPLGLAGNDPEYSADGRCLVFGAGHQEAQANGFHMSRIWVANADGSNPVQITPSDTQYPDHDFHPTWSPDGRRIAFESYRGGDDDHVLESGVFVIDLDGSDLRLVHWGAHHPAWEH